MRDHRPIAGTASTIRYLESFLTNNCYSLIVLLLIGVAFLLRVFRIETIPGVYPDEANYIDMSWNFFNLNFQWGCFSHSFLPRLPVPLLVMGTMQKIFGRDLITIRLISACIGTSVIPLLAFLHPKRSFRLYCFLAAIFYGFSPFCICYQRWGFTYTYLLPMIVGILWIRFRLVSGTTRAMWTVYGCLIGLALVTEPIAIAIAIYGWGALYPRFRTKIPITAVMSIVPIMCYLVFLYFGTKGAFLSDIMAIRSERFHHAVFQESSLVMTAEALFQTLGLFFVGGLIGLFLLPAALRRHALLLFSVLFVFFALLSADDFSLLVRESILLTPLLSLGVAAGVIRIIGMGLDHGLADVSFLQRLVFHGWSLDGQETFFSHRVPGLVRKALLWFVIMIAFYTLFLYGVRPLLSRFTTPLDYITVEDVQSLREACDYIANHVQPNDVVIASPVTRNLGCLVVSFMQYAVSQGSQGNPFFPYSLFRDRIVSPLTKDSITYALINPYNEKVEVSFSGVAQVMNMVVRWPVVFQRGQMRVMKNPASIEVSNSGQLMSQESR